MPKLSAFLRRAFVRRLAPIALVLQVIAAAQPGSPSEEGPLARLVQVAFAGGFGGPLSGKICTALGVTKDNEPLPVEQISASEQGKSRTFNVSRHRSRLDVIIALKANGETTVFLTTAKGELQKAILDKQGQPAREIPAAEVTTLFETEKSWWLDTWLKTYEAGAARK